ncbi:hypothetical protein Cantr_00717 [Candida viswanathii]|uniref:Uncharacterized protein n=1 Tax=Candida viswanathii TaxID=5486 RepID=A0A367YJQ3_9ASCO|nr:hypothetical protein Cantr_00717 [Candida viswanathii]
MTPTAVRLSQQFKIVPQYKYFLRRIPHFGIWAAGIAFFFGWPHVWVETSNMLVDAPKTNHQFLT